MGRLSKGFCSPSFRFSTEWKIIKASKAQIVRDNSDYRDKFTSLSLETQDLGFFALILQ